MAGRNPQKKSPRFKINLKSCKRKGHANMNNQTNSDTIIETGSTLDYLRMDNEVTMEVASVLSSGAWVERDDTGLECS